MNMRISIANIFTHLFLLLALLATASCSDWTDQKTVDIDPQHAKEQNPELWARYMETLRTYRHWASEYSYRLLQCIPSMTSPVLHEVDQWADWLPAQIADGNSCKATVVYLKVRRVAYRYPLNGSVLLRCLPSA